MSGDGPKVPNAAPEPPDRDDWRTTFRPDIPTSARIYDYFLAAKIIIPRTGLPTMGTYTRWRWPPTRLSVTSRSPTAPG